MGQFTRNAAQLRKLLRRGAALVGNVPPCTPRTCYAIAAGLIAATLIAAAPSLGYLRLASAPDWSRAMLLIALLQIAYAAWLTTVPHWTAAWVVMIVFSAAATIYAVTATMALMTPLDADLPLGLDAVRRQACGWCMAASAIFAAAAYYCGHVAQQWKRANTNPLR